MSLGITMGDSSFRAEVPVNSIAEMIARTYQSSKKQEAGAVSPEEDFSRVLYNVKQIAFNVSTAAAAIFGALAAVGIFSLTTGIVFTALFWTTRTLVLQNIRQTLTEFGGGEGSREPNFAVLKDKEAVQNYVNRSRSSQIFLEESWKAGFDVKEVFLWRSLVPLHVKSVDSAQDEKVSFERKERQRKDADQFNELKMISEGQDKMPQDLVFSEVPLQVSEDESLPFEREDRQKMKGAELYELPDGMPAPSGFQGDGKKLYD